jgi:hypothetical protein
MSKALPGGGDTTINVLVPLVATSPEQIMEQCCGAENITTLENMVAAQPLDIFPLIQYNREYRNNMELENFEMKLCTLNTNVYIKI